MPDMLDCFDKPYISGFDDIENDVVSLLLEQGNINTIEDICPRSLFELYISSLPC